MNENACADGDLRVFSRLKSVACIVLFLPFIVLVFDIIIAKFGISQQFSKQFTAYFSA
jgi:hypothetical protein